jgi:hypothetical protein
MKRIVAIPAPASSRLAMAAAVSTASARSTGWRLPQPTEHSQLSPQVRANNTTPKFCERSRWRREHYAERCSALQSERRRRHAIGPGSRSCGRLRRSPAEMSATAAWRMHAAQTGTCPKSAHREWLFIEAHYRCNRVLTFQPCYPVTM